MTLPNFADIQDTLTFLDSWEDRYGAIIDFGRALPPYPEDKRSDAHKVPGCASQVWLHMEWVVKNNTKHLYIIGDSDAFIVKGLVCILCSFYNNATLETLQNLNIEQTFADLGLNEHISKQRANGFFSMVERVKMFIAH